MKDKKYWFKVIYAVSAALGVILGLVAAVFSTKDAPRIFEKNNEGAKPSKNGIVTRKKTAKKTKKKKTARKKGGV